MCLRNCRLLLALALASLALVVASCGGGGGGSNTQPIPINHAPTLAIVEPAGGTIDLNVNTANFVDLKVMGDDQDGNKLHCLWTWDGGSMTPCEQDSTCGQVITARFTPPAYDGTCHVKATISDGEASAEKEFTIRVTGNGVQPSTELRIESIDVNPHPVAPSQSASLVADVENPEGKTLTYKWRTRFGQLSGTGTSATWTATKTPGIYGVYLDVSDGTTTITSGRAITVSGPSGGLRAQYYDTKREKNVVSLDKLVLTRIDPTVNNNWGKLSADPKLPPDGWGARWTGYVKGEEAGSYVFTAFVDDGIRIRVQNDAGQWVGVIPNDSENWDDHTSGAWLPEVPEAIQLQGGKWYPIEIEYFEGGGDAFVEVYWSVNGRPRVLLSQDVLKPPS